MTHQTEPRPALLHNGRDGKSQWSKRLSLSYLSAGKLGPDDDDELELLAPWNETVKAEIERRESNQNVNCQGARPVLLCTYYGRNGKSANVGKTSITILTYLLEKVHLMIG